LSELVLRVWIENHGGVVKTRVHCTVHGTVIFRQPKGQKLGCLTQCITSVFSAWKIAV
jgi:hypothetical protein